MTFGSREVRPEVVPDGPILRLAFGAVRNVLGDPVVRRIFLIFGVSFLANQMARPYLPVVVEGLVGTGPGLASAIGLVMGTAALVGGLVGPFGGAARRPDRVPDRAGGSARWRLDRAHRHALGAGRRGPRPAGGRPVRGDGDGQRDGLRPAGHGGRPGASLADPQPRVSAAVCGGHHRSGAGRDRRGHVRPGRAVPARRPSCSRSAPSGSPGVEPRRPSVATA